MAEGSAGGARAPQQQSIAARAVGGSLVSVGASLVTWGLGSVRLVLLTRFLLPADVGLAAQALLLLNFAVQFQTMGLNTALIHHQQADDRTLATYFTLRMGLVTAALALLAAATPLLDRLYPEMPLLGTVLLAYIAIELFRTANNVQATILTKRLAFRRLSVADVLSSAAMTLVAPLLAWQGWGVWALVAEQASGTLVRTLLIQVWRPRLGWERGAARRFWDFGKRMWAGSNLTYLLDNFDNFWVGAILGQSALGFYDRAYEFARYPRRVIANPILDVFLPTFATLQGEPLRLSRAFFRATTLMVRAGGWLSLVLLWGAHEGIALVGPQWLPMVPTFQLMIVYALLDPLATGAANLLVATGHPGWLTRTRWVQALLFIPAVAALGRWGGIEGVALAADGMALVGTVLLFAYSRRVVSYSMRALWLWPVVAMLVISLAVFALGPVWRSLPIGGALLGKSLFITLSYAALLWLTERDQLLEGWRMVWGLLRPRLSRKRS